MTLRMPVIWLFALMCLLPLYARAAELININTADAVLLDTLPGIGPTKAAAIIDYRTQHGPFVRIDDIQNVSGIGPSTYADIAPLITVGNATPPPSAPPEAAASSTTPYSTAATATASATSSASPEYIPIPTLRIVTEGDRTVSFGADTAFTAAVYGGKGNRRDDAFVVWTFGDGMQRTGARVLHRYYHPGEYVVVVRATTSDGGETRKEIRLTAKNASIRIASASAQGIVLKNDDTRALDLSLWRLSAGGKEFKLPESTQILPGSSIVFPPQITGLPTIAAAMLLYPSGETAATYPDTKTLAGVWPVSGGQPSAPAASYKEVQKVEPITSTKRNVQTHEKAVGAPAAATGLAAAGAALPPAKAASSGPFSLFRSPWTLGLFGVMALAGAAFIFL